MGKRGAPIGNRNGVKHGFYAKVMTGLENKGMEEAKVIEGLEDELALLRVKLRRLLENSPDRIDLHLKAVGMINRMVRIRYAITPHGKENLDDAITNVLREVAIPLGLEYIP